METLLDASMRIVSEGFNCTGKSHSNGGGTIPWAGDLDWRGRCRLSVITHIWFLVRTHCDQLPRVPATRHRISSLTPRQNKLFVPDVTLSAVSLQEEVTSAVLYNPSIWEAARALETSEATNLIGCVGRWLAPAFHRTASHFPAKLGKYLLTRSGKGGRSQPPLFFHFLAVLLLHTHYHLLGCGLPYFPRIWVNLLSYYVIITWLSFHGDLHALIHDVFQGAYLNLAQSCCSCFPPHLITWKVFLRKQWYLSMLISLGQKSQSWNLIFFF